MLYCDGMPKEVGFDQDDQKCQNHENDEDGAAFLGLWGFVVIVRRGCGWFGGVRLRICDLWC